MMFTVLFAVVLSCLGFFGADPLCRIMGSNETYHTMMRDYLHVSPCSSSLPALVRR